MSEHTPGPWVNRGTSIEGGDGFAVFIPINDPLTDRDEAERAANMRLATASPVMLAALRMARDFVLESDRSRNMPGWEKARAAVDAAIAEAGRQ